jgi:hypothetical protein
MLVKTWIGLGRHGRSVGSLRSIPEYLTCQPTNTLFH